MPGMARLTDLHCNPSDCCGCPACCHGVVGPAVTGSPDVLANNLNSLRKDFTDMGVHCCCCGPNVWGTMMGSSDVFINGKGSVRLGDVNWCCGGVGTIITASSDVFVN